jgi:hypothetical protein
MIELFGITIAYEAIVAIITALAIDELLPFLPTKANGITHAIVLGIKKSKLGRDAKRVESEKIDEVLQLMRKWDEQTTQITKEQNHD